MPIPNFIDEINDLKNDSSLRAAVRIHTILENNKSYFVKNFDEDFYNMITKNFEALAYSHTGTYNTPEFKDLYTRNYQMLSYRLDRLI